MTKMTWHNYTDQLFSDQHLGIFLDVCDATLTGEPFTQFSPAFKQAFLMMAELEGGAIANPDEDRQVGHYWLRDSSLAPSPSITSQIETTLLQIKEFSRRILVGELLSPAAVPYSDLLLIGIGGSALGPQFLADVLADDHGLNIHFIDNTDPQGIDGILSQLKQSLATTLVLVISKSGGTAETRNGMLETMHMFADNSLNFAQQAVAITGEGSQLHNMASAENWLAIFPMWDWVGGRTSVMSAVGLLPAALLGIDIEAFLEGAKQMDILTRRHKLRKNPAALLALSWLVFGDGHGKKDMVILPYKDKLLLFSRYLQQLIMESLGKRLDLDGQQVNQGISVYGNKGSTDQHAYVQQLRDGLDNFFVTFIEVLTDRQRPSILVDSDNTTGDYLFGFYKGTQTALRDSGRKSLTISIPDISPGSIGALIALYERAVGLYASVININAYHQPGVEAGKKAAGFVLATKNRILELLRASAGTLSIEEIARSLGMSGEEILIYQIIRHHATNHSMLVEGSLFHPAQLKVGLQPVK